MPPAFKTIALPANAPLPLISAANSLKRDLNVAQVPAGAPADLVVHLPTSITNPRLAQTIVPHVEASHADWHAIATANGVTHVTRAASPRSIAHALLALRDAAQTGADILTARDGFHPAAIAERLETWDLLCNQTARMCRGFNRARHFEEACRMGLTSVEINRSPDQNVYQVTHLKRPEDPYPWVNDYGLSLDMFAESELNRGTYPHDILERNRADLAAAAQEAAKWGLTPLMMCYEPRWVPESFFAKFPRLRGSRVDYPGRSFEPRYTLDIAMPIVLEHYRQLMAGLFDLVPALGYLHLWTIDSGSGYAYMEGLYPGPNGTRWSRHKPFGKLVGDFLETLSKEGRKRNPHFTVIQANTWEFSDGEWLALLKDLPEGVEVSHAVGVDEWRPIRDQEIYTYGGLPGAAASAGKTVDLANQDRAAGHEPYLELAVSCAWELEPCVGTDFVNLLARKMANFRKMNGKRFMARFGFTSPPMVSRAINHELLRDIFFGHHDAAPTLIERARAWSGNQLKEADAILHAWQTLDHSIDSFPYSTYFAPGWAMSSWGQWLTRPLVPDRTRCSDIELEELTTHEFYLDDDPGRVNIFFEGYQRIMREDDTAWFITIFDEDVLAPLDAAIKRLADLPSPAPYTRELTDRLRAHRAILASYRHWFAAQRFINLALLEHKDNPAVSPHIPALTKTIELEISNLTALADLLDTSPYILLAETERARNVYRYAQIARLLRKKTKVMQSHLHDAPGPWFPELVHTRERLTRPRPRQK